MRSCRTASVFAMGVVAAVMSAAACRDAPSAGTVSAHLDVQSPELYLGHLEGTAPVAEHSHHAWRPKAGSKLVAVQMYSPPGPEQRFVALAAADEDASARDAP